jgi:hypothetical protein
MKEDMNGNEPFLCLEVESLNGFSSLSKRFDSLFPKRIIRIMMNGKYTPYFYLGENKWIYKQYSDNVPDLTCKVMLDENPLDFINDMQLDLYDYFNIPLDNFRVIRDISIKNKEYAGMFLSNGKIHIFDQYLLLNAKYFAEILQSCFESSVLIDLTNIDENGVIIIETKKNILGNLND